jgi:hypothetical protein
LLGAAGNGRCDQRSFYSAHFGGAAGAAVLQAGLAS